MASSNPFLAELILLRHDPELVERLRAEALRGNTDAQYGLGLVYAEGRGVPQDEVEAFAWLSVAILQGDRDAEELREIVRQDLTPEQVRLGLARAADYVGQVGARGVRH